MARTYRQLDLDQRRTLFRLVEARRGRARQRGVTSGLSEVAIGQAALGEIWASSASGVGAASSAMASTCM
jgi:hypothetical protein